MTALDVLKRLASATGSPHFGGIDPDSVTWEGFALPGGGMSCHMNYESSQYVTIMVCSLGGLPRATVELFIALDGEISNVTSPLSQLPWEVDHDYKTLPTLPSGEKFRGFKPRPRDIERLDAWVRIARGENIPMPWHGRPAEIPPGEEHPRDTVIALITWADHVNARGETLRQVESLDWREVAHTWHSHSLSDDANAYLAQQAFDGAEVDWLKLVRILTHQEQSLDNPSPVREYAPKAYPPTPPVVE